MAKLKVLYKSYIIIMGILTALIVGAVIILAVHENVFNTYGIILTMPFKSFRSLCEVFTRMIPLMLVSLGICVSQRCGIINIGAEGQMAMGVIATCALAMHLANVPRIIAIPLCIIAGALAGGLYAFIPGVLKVKLEVSELLSTVMMNYIATQLYLFCIRVPLIDPNEQTGTPMSQHIPASTELHKLFKGTSLHQGIFVAFILAIIIFILLFKSTYGYKMRASGASSRAAKYGGINVSKYVVISMVISGACAGIAGGVELMGVQGRAMAGITSGYGFSGIVVALFGGLHPLGIIPASFFFGILLYSQVNLQILTDVPPNLVMALQGLLILIIVSIQMLLHNPYEFDKFVKRFVKKNEKEEV